MCIFAQNYAMNTSDIKILISEFEKHRKSDRAKEMSAYMKGQFPFVGVQAPMRRELGKAFIKKINISELGKLESFVYQLWDLPEREYQYIALQLLEHVRNNLTPSHLEFLIDLVVKKSWWDTIDWLAPKVIGTLLSNYPELIEEYIPIWIESENIWINRTAILFQLRYKSETDFALLTNIIDRLKHKNEFFVKKAIGWALREYSKTDAEAVSKYISQANLLPLSEKEGLKYIHKNNKLKVEG